MRKIILIIMLCTSYFGFSQIVVFNTENSTSEATGTVKMKCKFEIYEDKLVQHFTDKNTLKYLKKSGQPTFVSYKYNFNKVENENTLYYEHTSKNIELKVILKVNSEDKYIVNIKTLSGEESLNTSTVYY